MIEFASVRKEYPGGTVAVEDFSLTIPSHAVAVLVGSSGCGKTTLLRMINRMVEPSGGAVSIDGVDVRSMDAVKLRRSIGYVLQAGGLLPHRTIADNVATVPVLEGRSRRQARQEALGLLERVGLDTALADRYPGQLSGGQQQRVGVARALAADPNILLMDEPFGAVDPIVRDQLQAEMRSLQAELGKTIVFDEAFALGDEVLVLRKGADIAQRGTPAEILANPADEFVASFVGAGSARRTLRIREVDGRSIVVDGDDRPTGVLAR